MSLRYALRAVTTPTWAAAKFFVAEATPVAALLQLSAASPHWYSACVADSSAAVAASCTQMSAVICSPAADAR